MHIGLIDVDGHNFPNLALMKISAYHKLLGDSVEWVNYWQRYDKVYMAKVFTNSPDIEDVILADEIVQGGTGYDINSKLPSPINQAFPDYSIYPQYNYAVGFLTRGCSRNCPFCIVNQKEGSAHQVADLGDFWQGQKLIKLLDPNILEYSRSLLLLQSLVDSNATIDFTQGLDIRLLSDRHIDLLKQVKIKIVHFADDLIQWQSVIENRLAAFKEATGWKRQKVSVYILVNYNTTLSEDLHRINFCKSLDFSPYVMVYEKNRLPKGSVYHRLQRWCNARIIYSCDFEEYKR